MIYNLIMRNIKGYRYKSNTEHEGIQLITRNIKEFNFITRNVKKYNFITRYIKEYKSNTEYKDIQL